MKRILVPVDFSTHTTVSCRYALRIAVASGAEMILFHSFFDQYYYSDGGLATGFESGILLTDEIILDFYRQKEKKLHELAEGLKSDLPQPDRISIVCRMESGNPEVQIINAIDQIKPDLIVMGSGGIGKKGLMAGSVARRIIDQTQIPVIAVPDSDEVPDIENIAYMTAFEQDDSRVISEIDHLLENFRVNIFCLHLSKNEPTDEVQHLMDSIMHNPAIAHLEGRLSYHISMYYHDIEVLQNFMEYHHISLIAFIPHKRNMFEKLFYQGITREDLFKTRIPIMAVRPV